ncbi:hypothetical protein ABZ759_07715 [Streptomyces sp. NPDC047860]|uniref:hypothetical protein n=1 Tax=Streptomyces sp. NPDC047860 TaxID=3155743 RepID=UPI0033C808F2
MALRNDAITRNGRLLRMRRVGFTFEYFAESSKRLRTWGMVLLGVSGGLWIWFAVLLFTPYTADQARGNSAPCESPFFTDRRDANVLAAEGSPCVAERDWPELLAVLGASMPTTIAGTAVLTAGSISIRLNRHMSEVVDALTERDNSPS